MVYGLQLVSIQFHAVDVGETCILFETKCMLYTAADDSIEPAPIRPHKPFTIFIGYP